MIESVRQILISSLVALIVVVVGHLLLQLAEGWLRRRWKRWLKTRSKKRQAREKAATLTRIQSDEWTLGWRRSYLYASEDDEVVIFRSFYQKYWYPVDVPLAKCLKIDKEHRSPAPEPTCDCGYYAFPERETALDYAQNEGRFLGSALLYVGLGGRRLASPKHYRGERMKIGAIWIDNRCEECLRKKVYRLTDRDYGDGIGEELGHELGNETFWRLCPLCPDHTRDELWGSGLTADDLAERLAVRVHYLYQDVGGLVLGPFPTEPTPAPN